MQKMLRERERPWTSAQAARRGPHSARSPVDLQEAASSSGRAPWRSVTSSGMGRTGPCPRLPGLSQTVEINCGLPATAAASPSSIQTSSHVKIVFRSGTHGRKGQHLAWVRQSCPRGAGSRGVGSFSGEGHSASALRLITRGTGNRLSVSSPRRPIHLAQLGHRRPCRLLASARPCRLA
jgi:hypothetical protein